MLLHKNSKSVRIPRAVQKKIGRKIVRLSLNPVLYERSQSLVRWNRGSRGTRSAVSVIQAAFDRYPQLSVSSAVEMVLVDLLVQHPPQLTPQERLQSERFQRLSLLDQIRLTQKRLRAARYLQSLK